MTDKMTEKRKKLNKPTYTATLCVLGALLVAAITLYYLPDFHYLDDSVADGLIKEACVRLAASLLIAFFVATSADRGVFSPNIKGLPINLLIALPCFAVAIVNFPFSALITGEATVERVDLIWLLIVDCVLIGFFEELFFRGMLLNFVADRFIKKRGGVFVTVIITSALFGLFHLINLTSGAGISGTLLQVVYTFLIGAMLAFVMLKTKDLWLCALIHAVFDIGGAIVVKLGSGAFQDAVFWILTVAVGVVCGVYVFVMLMKMQKDANREGEEI